MIISTACPTPGKIDRTFRACAPKARRSREALHVDVPDAV